MNTFDLFASRRERDRALLAVEENCKIGAAVREFIPNHYPKGTLVMGEDIKRDCEANGIHSRKPQAWGAAINWAVRFKILEYTGQHGQMTKKSSKARESKIYRVTGRHPGDMPSQPTLGRSDVATTS